MALTKRYVRADAAGGGDGTTDAASGGTGAFTWAEMITDINTPRVGYKYLVKSGTYANGTTTTTLTGDGTTTSPNVIEGFNATEGDLLANGRDSNGALDTTNFPAISYTGTTARFNASGANYLVLRCLSITSAANADTLAASANDCYVEQCIIKNTGTNAASGCVALNSTTRGFLINCDCSTATTGAGYAVKNGNGSYVIGCRVKCVPGIGIKHVNAGIAINNTVYESTTGITHESTSQSSILIGNTIVNCTGDGIDIVTSTTAMQFIIGNHITGNGGYGIDFNTSTCAKILGWNRFRDNTSANINGGGDWEEGTSVNNVTSDDTDATDFTDQANDNYALLTTAAAITAGIGYRNPIGAHGAGSFPSGAGGSALHLGGLGQTGIGSF